MGTEIERKFLVAGEGWRSSAHGVRIVQGYLTREKERVVRVRTEDERAVLTIKGISRGASRAEFEYEIPLADAKEMLLTLCLKPLIDKTRYHVPHRGSVWDVDEFHSPRAGLILAEVELSSAEQPFERPEWLGSEVTGDPRYYNQNMT